MVQLISIVLYFGTLDVFCLMLTGIKQAEERIFLEHFGTFIGSINKEADNFVILLG